MPKEIITIEVGPNDTAEDVRRRLAHLYTNGTFQKVGIPRWKMWGNRLYAASLLGLSVGHAAWFWHTGNDDMRRVWSVLLCLCMSEAARAVTTEVE